MGSLKKWYEKPPFWEGVASSFDLFGFTGISLKSMKKINADRINRNTIEYDFLMVSQDMKLAVDQYGREIKVA